MNPAEFSPLDPRLEQAINEIRDISPDDAEVEAATARVWACLGGPQHLRSCADFQALISEYRAGRLNEARAALLQDHLHECVACRKVYEGRVVSLPAAQWPARRAAPVFRWAMAAAVVLAAGGAVWFVIQEYGVGPGRAVVQSVNGTLFALGADGTLHSLAAGQNLPDGVEIRTAKDSGAMLRLRDGSLVELRERAAVSTSGGAEDLTLHLNRGDVIVQAAHRRKGHLYVATADCRVAVTGTVFSVVSGVKGSRVSVVEGEVHVAQDNQDHVLHPGDQISTTASLEPRPLGDDIGWSRNRDRLLERLQSLRIQIRQIQLPALRYSSRLIGRLPANTAAFASIPNFGQYLVDAQAVLAKNLEESPELRAWWEGRAASSGVLLEKLRAASGYLGDEVALVGLAGTDGHIGTPVFLAETRRPGFREFLKEAAPGITVTERAGLVVFGPNAPAVEALAVGLDSTSAQFQTSPFYHRIADAYHQGAGLLLCVDFSQAPESSHAALRYILAGRKQIRDRMETRATFGFGGEKPGIASWLAAPGPMGSLDYVSPEATLAAAFVVRDPRAIVDQVASIGGRFVGRIGKPESPASQPVSGDAAALRSQLASALGGEFSLSFDGPIFPPSWKLVAEVYDPARAQAAIRQIVDAYNRDAAASGGKPLRTSEETVSGRVYYMIAAADPNPLTEAHYTFADGYLIAGPTRALISKALETKTAGASITHSAQFMSFEPSDQFANYSAVLYENLGTTLAPLAGLLGAFAPSEARGHLAEGLGNVKPIFVAAYAGPDQVTVALTGRDLPLGQSEDSLLSGDLGGILSNVFPIARIHSGATK